MVTGYYQQAQEKDIEKKVYSRFWNFDCHTIYF